MGEFLVFALQKRVDALSGCLWRGGVFVWAKMSAVWFKGSLKSVFQAALAFNLFAA